MFQPAVDTFLEACGAQVPLPLEVVHRDRGVIVRRQLPLPFALIGRDERADLRLDGKGVSRRHAFLQLVAGRWWWVDLDSRTGTYPASNPASTMPLLDRDGICISNYTIRVATPDQAVAQPHESEPSEADRELTDDDVSDSPANPLTTDSDDASVLPRLALEFHGSAEGLRTWRMDRALALMGRSSLCKVRLHSPMISRVHCALVNTPLGLWVVDLLGRKGTYVNGMSVRWGRLEPEDEIQIDQFRIRVRYLAPLPRAHISMPVLQPANDEHGLTVRPSAIGDAIRLFPSSASAVWPREEATENSQDQAVAPVELAMTMTGAESLMMPLVKQFSLMQQQMFDQFQHTLVMMAQMFGTVQKEQMALIRQELEQIQELTRQLHTLSVDKSSLPSPPRPAPSPTPPPAVAAKPSPSVKPTPAVADSHASAVPPPKFEEGDVHAWLTKRLATLQEERQSRWQKVLSLLTGK